MTQAMNMMSGYDYSNLLKVYLATGVVTREPVDPMFYGLSIESMADLSPWGFYDYAWWPYEVMPILGEYEKYDPSVPEVLSADFPRKMAIVTNAVIPWTAEEIEADMVPKRDSAIYLSNRDTDAFYNTYIGRREWEDVVRAKAQAFADAGYTGTAPEAVTAWATEYSVTAQEAADAIIATFADQGGVMGQIFAKRDKCQAAMRAAMVNSELNAAVTEWQTFINDLSASLNITRRYDY